MTREGEKNGLLRTLEYTLRVPLKSFQGFLAFLLLLLFAMEAQAEPVYLCTSRQYTKVYGQRYKPCANFEQKFKRAFVWSILDSYKREKLPRTEALKAAKSYKCLWRNL